jgi:hypothetical protein
MAPGGRPEDMAAVADVLLSAPPAQEAPAAAPREAPGEPLLAPTALPPAAPLSAPGLCVLIPTGLDGPDRRRTAIAVAQRLAPHGSATALFLFEHGQADAHILGEVGCGRLGPQSYLSAEGPARATTDLVIQCDHVVVIALDGACGALGRLGRVAARTVFVATSDAESLLETYRGLKSCRASAAELETSIFIVGANGPEEAGRLHRRLSRAARQCLGMEVAIEGFLPNLDAVSPRPDHPEPLRVLAQAPAEEIWLPLIAAGKDRWIAPAAPLPAPAATEAPPAPAMAARPMAPADEICPAFMVWTPEDRATLLAAIERQGAAPLDASLRALFRTEVDEPGAPPLTAVGSDGALVAVLVARPGEPVDTRAACRWLTLHRHLIACAYPCAGIAEEAEPSAIVLAPLSAPAVADGLRRFLPVRMGGRQGIVMLP